MRRKARRKNNNNMLPIVLIGLGALLVVGVLVWSAIQQNRGSAGVAPGNTANIPYPEVKRVTLADAKAAFDGKEAVFVDVRDPDTYNAGHVPGSVNIPYALLANRVEELDPDQWIITYCT